MLFRTHHFANQLHGQTASDLAAGQTSRLNGGSTLRGYAGRSGSGRFRWDGAFERLRAEGGEDFAPLQNPRSEWEVCQG
jgi:hypothetical protein